MLDCIHLEKVYQIRYGHVMLYVVCVPAISLSGGVTITGDMIFTLSSESGSQFNLTCISTGGPATTVTWTRDSVTVTDGTETVLNDPDASEYTHTLTVTGGEEGHYTCSVSNNKPSDDSEGLSVQGIYIMSCVNMLRSLERLWTWWPGSIYLPPAPSPPSDVTVTQIGVDTVEVSWTLSGGPSVTGYTIYYQRLNGRGTASEESVGRSTTTIDISGLTTWVTYSITVLATSITLPSTGTDEEITIRKSVD